MSDSEYDYDEWESSDTESEKSYSSEERSDEWSDEDEPILTDIQTQLIGTIEQELDHPIHSDIPENEDKYDEQIMQELLLEEDEDEDPQTMPPVTQTMPPVSTDIQFDKPKDQYGEFSNLWDISNQKSRYKNELKLELDGRNWSSVEEYFQSQKYVTLGETGTKYIDFIRAANTQNKKMALGNQKSGRIGGSKLDPKVPAYDAFTIGTVIRSFKDAGLKPRSDWETVKLAMLTKAITAKFTQNDDLKSVLLSTGDKQIKQQGSKDDNQLGIILMNLRARLRTAPVPVMTAPSSSLLVTRDDAESDRDFEIRKAFSERAYILLSANGLDQPGAILVGRCYLNMAKTPGVSYDKQITDIIDYVKANI